MNSLYPLTASPFTEEGAVQVAVMSGVEVEVNVSEAGVEGTLAKRIELASERLPSPISFEAETCNL